MAASHPAHLRLLADCVLATALPDRSMSRLASIAQPITDWDGLVALAARHRVSAAIADSLARAGAAVPGEAGAMLARQAGQDTRKNFRLAAETVRVARLLEAGGIKVIVLKGMALSNQIYGNLAVRQSHDLDLLVSPEQFDAAVAAVLADGYQRWMPADEWKPEEVSLWRRWRKDMAFLKGGLLLELHYRPCSNPKTSDRLGIDQEAATCVMADSGVRALTGDCLFAYLCEHGCRSAWSRLKWLGDIAVLLAREDRQGQWRLYQAATSRGLKRPAGQAILLAADVFGLDIDPKLLAAITRDPVTRWMTGKARAILSDTRVLSEVPKGSTDSALIQLAASPRLSALAWELAAGFVDIAAIREANLPRHFSFLWPVARVLGWLRRQAKLGQPLQ
jgi:hypothetical protein